MAEQISMFDGSQQFKITKPIRLIECFAGYGSQALALKYLGANFEHWKIAEWAVKSIQAYKDIHFTDDNTDYSSQYDKEWLIDYLFEKGISADYNKPMTREQIARMGEEKIRTVYNNIIATHNLVSVCNVRGEDLEITDTEHFTYLLTYSFPCQDLSICGKQKGMRRDSGTRSSMLWEIERILEDCKERGQLPQILLMENVPQVHSQENVDSFYEWINFLESIGYKSKWRDLNTKNYGVPQTRDRTFLVSVFGDFYTTFPEPIRLEKTLNDILEENVPEKYYLKDYNIDTTTRTKSEALTNEPKCVQVGSLCGGKWDKMHEQSRRVYSVGGICPTIPTSCGGNHEPKIAEVVGGIGEKKSNGGTQYYQQDRIYKGEIALSHPANLPSGSYYYVVEEQNEESVSLRVRKLTPRECFRLMGVKDEDFDKVKKNQSTSSLYHLAGDSIVVDVLMAIFNEIL